MSDQINDGGQAFPMSFGCDSENYSGMSLRDWFAGVALQGILSKSWYGRATGRSASIVAYEIADEMLAARKEAK